MKTTSLYRVITSSVAVAAAALALSGLQASAAAADDELDWKAMTISPVANPIYFESPIIQSEVRPIFMYHNISDDFIGGFARVYAVQLRYAVTERLAVIASKDGYIQLRPNVPGLKEDGWANIAAGVKYAVIDDKENAFILTPGLVFEIPIGSEDVFQGNGDGAFNLFVSTMKGWDKFHVTANLGTTIPINLDEETASLRYSLQLDYYTCRWFIPFVVANGQTVLNDADGPAYGVEGFDLINFGTSNAKGFTEIALGAGFRSRPFKIMDVGFAYEKAVTHPEGIFDDRFTVDMIIRF